NAGETIQDKNGHFITVGNLSSGGFIVRYDKNGNPIFSKYFESFNFDSVDTLSGGGYLVSSRSKDPFLFGDRKLVLLELNGSFEITGSRVLEIPFAFPRGHFKFDENGNGILMAGFSANRTIVIKFDPRFDLDYAYQFPVEFNIANVSSFNLPNEHLFIYGSNRNLSYAAILDKNGLLPNCRGNEICFELIEGAKPQGKIFQMVPISPPQVEAPTYIVKDTVGFEWKEDCLPSNYVPSPGFLVKDTFCTNEFLSLIDTTAKWIDQTEWRIEDSVFNNFVFTDTAGFLLGSPGQLEISQKIWFNGCPDSISKIIVVVVPPRLSLGSDTLLCFGEELILNPEISGALTFVWENQPDSLLQNRSVSTSGTYIGRASNNGCFVKDSIIVDFFQANLASFEIQLSNDTINCGYPHIVAGFSGANPLTWKFENGSVNLDSILISQPGLYQIVINQDPCEEVRSFEIFEERCTRDIYFPSAFSPNSDGINDFFRPYGDENILIEELLIFDRWGNLLFKKENLNPGLNDKDFWDGSFRGERLNLSILVWSASLIWPDGSKERLKGDVSLVR
ncbi:MAG: gliding motility-associated C-terminal domain-containing protein, partial [Saprospiraceae bacterium]